MLLITTKLAGSVHRIHWTINHYLGNIFSFTSHTVHSNCSTPLLEINLGQEEGSTILVILVQVQYRKKKELKSEINTATVHRPLSLSFECFFMVHVLLKIVYCVVPVYCASTFQEICFCELKVNGESVESCWMLKIGAGWTHPTPNATYTPGSVHDVFCVDAL